jgi:hydroxyquinol 1,2-dioxygenase
MITSPPGSRQSFSPFREARRLLHWTAPRRSVASNRPQIVDSPLVWRLLRSSNENLRAGLARPMRHAQFNSEIPMRNLNEHNITDAVLESFASTPRPRLKEILGILVRHLHEFARDAKLTEAEWMEGIRFLTATGQKCNEIRQEFILLSDTLGLSQLVVAQNNSRPQDATEQTVFGPFHVPGAPRLDAGSDMTRDRKGIPCFVAGTVTAGGLPVEKAAVDVWQADAEGFYDVQDKKWSPEEMALRAVFRTDARGRFSFRTILPASYPVPTDGPVGEMLRATGRRPMRPAHIHFMIAAGGHETLITHIFVDGDPHLESDAVFGVRSSCIGRYVRHNAGRAPDGTKMDEPFYTLTQEFVLNPVRGNEPAYFADRRTEEKL